MTEDTAREIIAIYEKGRLTVNGSGTAAFDYLAAHFKISAGEAVRRYFEACDTLQPRTLPPAYRPRSTQR